MAALDDAAKEAQVKMDHKFTDFYELLQNFVEDGALDEEYTSLIRMYFSSLFHPVEIARVSLEKDRRPSRKSSSVSLPPPSRSLIEMSLSPN
jgi:hypothetical protein